MLKLKLELSKQGTNIKQPFGSDSSFSFTFVDITYNFHKQR